MQDLKSQMKKMDLMKPISLSLDGKGTTHNNTKLSKVNTTLCYDLMQDHEESMILNRSVNHPVSIQNHSYIYTSLTNQTNKMVIL